MKAHYLLAIAAATGASLLLAIGVSVWSCSILGGLEYDGAQPFRIGGHGVTIIAQSYKAAGAT